MKLTRLLISLLFLLIISLSITVADVNETVVAYYSFDNLSDNGNITDDYLGHYNGTYRGSATFIETSNCVYGGCLDLGPGFSGFPGPDDRVLIPYMTLTGNFSFSFWTYVRGSAAGGGDGGRVIPIGCYGGSGDCGTTTARNIFLRNKTGGYQLSMYFPTAINSTVTVQANETFTLNVWEHWTMVFNGTNIHYYKNGIEVGIARNLGSPGYYKWGCFGDCYNNDYDYNGIIDELIIYNRTITGEEVTTNYANGTPQPPFAPPPPTPPPTVPARFTYDVGDLPLITGDVIGTGVFELKRNMIFLPLFFLLLIIAGVGIAIKQFR
jgi:hypothetical protein